MQGPLCFLSLPPLTRPTTSPLFPFHNCMQPYIFVHANAALPLLSLNSSTIIHFLSILSYPSFPIRRIPFPSLGINVAEEYRRRIFR